jgi:hypothetical protein
VSETAEIRRVLRVTFDGDSMRGSLNDCGGRLRPFSGWLDLLAAIEELRADVQDRGPADNDVLDPHTEGKADTCPLQTNRREHGASRST